MTKSSIRPSNLLFSCFAAFALATLAGCADEERHSSSSDSSTTTMSPDSKNMTHRGDQNSH